MRQRKVRILAALMGTLLTVQSAGGAGFFYGGTNRVYAASQRSAIVNATTLNVRNGAGTGAALIRKLSYGAAVTVVGEEKAADGVTWYKIRYGVNGGTEEGYASSAYIKFPVSYSTDPQFETYMNQQGFPESYKDSLRTLHTEFPSWVFQVQNTGLDWNEVIDNESKVGANLVASGSLSSWKSTEYGAYDWGNGHWTGFDGASWVAASRDIVSYYMDPRNFLNEIYVFQFLLHTYDSAHQTKEGLKSLATGTFLEKAITSGGESTGENTDNGNSSSGTVELAPGQNYGPGMSTVAVPSNDVATDAPGLTGSTRETHTVAVPSVEYGPGMDASVITGDNTGEASTSPVPEGQSYIDIIMDAASQSGVNPYVIGAMILQEQGKGTSGSISGKTAGYEGIYNFFNVGAYQTDTMSAVTRGLWYAAQSGSYGRPWNTIAKSIAGGASYYGENFVSQGQDTFYLKKFNVQGSNLYKHQYMTNVEGAAGEGAKLSRAYTDEMKKETLVFKIPVYRNMPEAACVKPAVDGSPNNKLSALEAEGYALTPTFNRDTESYDVIVDPSVDKISVKASAIDSKASVSGTGIIDLQSGNNTINVDVKAENGAVRTYRLNVVRQNGAPAVPVTGNAGGAQTSGQNVGPGQTTGPGQTSGSSTQTSGQNTGSAQNVGPGQSPESSSATETSGNNGTGNNDQVQVGIAPS